MRRRIAIGLAATLWVAACATDDGARRDPATDTTAVTTADATATTVAVTSTAATSTSTTTGGTSMLPNDDVIDDVRRQIADRYGYAVDEVVVRRVEAVEWPDAALGCPVNEQEYEPGPVPGYRIVLGRGDLEFHFHGAEGVRPFRCQFLD